MEKTKTAMQISIDRKENELARIEAALGMHIWQNDVEFHTLDAQKEILQNEIEEDKKILEIEKEQIQAAWLDGSFQKSINGFDQYYNETYGDENT